MAEGIVGTRRADVRADDLILVAEPVEFLGRSLRFLSRDGRQSVAVLVLVQKSVEQHVVVRVHQVLRQIRLREPGEQRRRVENGRIDMKVLYQRTHVLDGVDSLGVNFAAHAPVPAAGREGVVRRVRHVAPVGLVQIGLKCLGRNREVDVRVHDSRVREGADATALLCHGNLLHGTDT